MNDLSTITRPLEYIDTYLDGYEGLIDDADFYATLDPAMDEGEQMDAHMAFMQYWGVRHTLGELYLTGQLLPEQVSRLADLDRKLLQEAPVVQAVYGPSLRSLLHNLFNWGTPLAEQAESVQVETSLATLAELAGIDTTPPEHPSQPVASLTLP